MTWVGLPWTLYNGLYLIFIFSYNLLYNLYENNTGGPLKYLIPMSIVPGSVESSQKNPKNETRNQSRCIIYKVYTPK